MLVLLLEGAWLKPRNGLSVLWDGDKWQAVGEAALGWCTGWFDWTQKEWWEVRSRVTLSHYDALLALKYEMFTRWGARSRKLQTLLIHLFNHNLWNMFIYFVCQWYCWSEKHNFLPSMVTWILVVCPLCDSSSDKFWKEADIKADYVVFFSFPLWKILLYSALFKPRQKRGV